MTTRVAALSLFLLAGTGPVAAQDSFEPGTREEKITYAMGLSLSQSLLEFRLSDGELAALQAGLVDGTRGNPPQVALHVWGRRAEGLRQERIREARERAQTAGLELIAQAQGEPGAVEKPSGLIHIELEAGTGASPRASDRVTVHYHGTLPDGSVFDTTRGRQPATFALDQVIACWTEGLQLMKVGGKSRLICPAKIAYGEKGFPPLIDPDAALAFEVELIAIAD